MTTITALKKAVVERIISFGVEPHEARREAELIVEHVTQMSLSEQIRAGDRPIESLWAQRVEALLDRRRERQPLQYALGHTYFRDLKLICRPGVFIPRGDTETVVCAALDLLPPADGSTTTMNVMEIGPGAGTICISLLSARKDLCVTAIEISEQAFELTFENAAAQNVAARLHLVRADWLSFAQSTSSKFEMLVSNPPYIPRSEKSQLQPEVGLWEPESALFGGDDDGLATYRAIALHGPDLLNSGGWAVVEVGDGQAAGVIDIFETSRWGAIGAHKDVHGLTRAISAQAPKNPLSKRVRN